MPGPAMEASCGAQAVSDQVSDNYGSIQGELRVVSNQDDYEADECNMWLCKGYKFADNKDNVYSYKAGEKVDFTVDIRAPHTGVANVSVVDTSSNSVIGSPLISWPIYASVATGVKDEETSFRVTIPDTLGSQCATAGDCVLQWYWHAKSIDQTYESCVDFTVDGSGSGEVPVKSSKRSSSVGSRIAAATSAPVIPVIPAQTPKPTPVGSGPSTFATSARQSATYAGPEIPFSATDAPDTDDSVLPFPADSAEDIVSWLQSLLGNLVGN